MPKITIKQKNLTLDAPFGENLMFYLQSQGLPVASSCSGDGICGKCRMKINLPITLFSTNQLNRLHQLTIESDSRKIIACWQ